MAEERSGARYGMLRWWGGALLMPALLLASGILVIVALGVAQRTGWISAGGGGKGTAAATKEDVLYICPMMCTPPLSEPGRCPVCAMELVASTSGDDGGGERSIEIDPVARRVANITTAAAERMAVWRPIRAVGHLTYDESQMKTLAAYVDGRIDRLYADYTGVVVEKGDDLALLYSPQLFTAQTELLAARRTAQQVKSSDLPGSLDTGNLYASARRKLIDLGMTEEQVARIEETETPVTRIELVAPIGGTVIDKLAHEGEYVKTGQSIYRLADLSSLWLVLELFPEDSAAVRYGQRVEAEVASLPGEAIAGRVAFIDPVVDRRTRTVAVRVVIDNGLGRLKVGDYVTAHINVRASHGDATGGPAYDPDLAGKWISPRHPHVIQDEPGQCRMCGIDLVPATAFGFAEEPVPEPTEIVVPRDAVLMAGGDSVAYVEVEAGRFELRVVELGPSLGDRIVILDGIEAGEEVAVGGNFLIDSQMQLAGKPSLIDPNKLEPATDDGQSGEDAFEIELPPIGPIELLESGPESPGGADAADEEGMTAEVRAALAKLSAEDREVAVRQKTCPVADMPLGSMGPPIKVDVEGTPVFICCEGCRGKLLAEPAKYLAKLREGADE